MFDRIERGWTGWLMRRSRINQVSRQISVDLADALAKPPRIAGGLADDALGPCDVILRREGKTIHVLQPRFRPVRDSRLGIRNRTSTFVYWMLHSPVPVREMVCNTSDGDAITLARYVFSGTEESVLLPDFYFFRDRGYATFRKVASEVSQPWEARTGELIWRGAPHGRGIMSLAPSLRRHPGLQQRLAMAFACRGGRVDFRFTRGAKPDHMPALESFNLIGDRVPSESWGGRKFAVDIDGFSNAWDNLFHRLLLGCCVLKVGSAFGFRQWYYDRLIPWQHYVPIAADLSDLDERIDWALSHDKEARAIAAEGQALVRSMTFESERTLAGEIIARTAEHVT